MIGRVAELGLMLVLAGVNDSTRDSLNVPSIQRLLARNVNRASSGVVLTALIVAISTGVFTPLSGSRGAWVAGAVTAGIYLSPFAAATAAVVT